MQQTTGTYTINYDFRTYCVRNGDRCISLAYDAHNFLPLVFADGKWTVNFDRDAICAYGGAVHYTDTREFRSRCRRRIQSPCSRGAATRR